MLEIRIMKLDAARHRNGAGPPEEEHDQKDDAEQKRRHKRAHDDRASGRAEPARLAGPLGEAIGVHAQRHVRHRKPGHPDEAGRQYDPAVVQSQPRDHMVDKVLARFLLFRRHDTPSLPLPTT